MSKAVVIGRMSVRGNSADIMFCTASRTLAAWDTFTVLVMS